MEKTIICITRMLLSLLCLSLFFWTACVSSNCIKKSRAELAVDLMNEVNERKNVLGKGSLKLVKYDFCENDERGFIFRYPCNLDTSFMNAILTKFSYVDSIKGVEIHVQSLYYPFYVYDYPFYPIDSLPRKSLDRFDPQKGDVFINKDGSMTSECGSLSSDSCSYFFAEVSVSKIVNDKVYYNEIFNVYIDSLFEQSKYPDFFLNELAGYWGNEDLLKSEFIMKPYDGEILYNLCWDGKISYPCNLDPRIKERIDLFSKGKGSVMLITQTMGGDFFADALSKVHFCQSTDGNVCSKTWFLVDDGTNFHKFVYDYKDDVIREIDLRNLVDSFRNTWTYYDESDQMVKVFNYGGQFEIKGLR